MYSSLLQSEQHPQNRAVTFYRKLFLVSQETVVFTPYTDILITVTTQARERTRVT